MKLLVLSAWFPFPADNGSKIRTQHLLRSLAREHTVDLACFYQGEREAAQLGKAEEICRQVAAFPKPSFDADKMPSVADLFSRKPRFIRSTYSDSLAREVQEWRAQRNYDAIVCMTWGMAPYVLSQSSVRASVKRILDQHNIESGIFRRGLKLRQGISRLRGWLTYQKFRRYEGRTCAGFSTCSVVSEREKQELEKILPPSAATNIVTIPNGVDTALWEPRWRPVSRNASTHQLVFTGSRSYGVNVEGLRWFLRTVYPRLKADFPDVRLGISGDAAASLIPEAEGDPSVTFTGYLSDLRPLLRKSAALVVPLRLGGGTRLKILEAMASGLPVISTPVGAEGLKVKPGQHLLIAHEPEEFVDAVGQVFKQPLRTLAMTARARKLVEEEYDWGPIGRNFARLVEEVAA
ncbi:MAG: glycosyltransferase [Armatimonadetes bacterium]|nr:glycosyltransferase [Armatimonadota bacterium]NIM23296.1 glycosyltransferase [Armatimonadota bacterium]NIM67160.1 glycosyltransferase [Armatimonadota bacterium]NIM75687.1 glycosyltransferase [Armatimonadota bacterium]NIN05349.1 glycosyltransferase [Armatimonadota bacterium]